MRPPEKPVNGGRGEPERLVLVLVLLLLLSLMVGVVVLLLEPKRKCTRGETSGRRT